MGGTVFDDVEKRRIAAALRHAQATRPCRASSWRRYRELRIPNRRKTPWQRAASAKSAGVSLLAGSFTRSRVRFCASPIMRPRSKALVDFRRNAALRHKAKLSMRLSFFFGSDLYLSASQAPKSCALDDSGNRSCDQPDSSSQRELCDAFAFKPRTRAPATRRASTVERTRACHRR